VTIPGAGTITLTDGTNALGALDFNAATGYTALSGTSDAGMNWAFADTLNVSAAGDANGVAQFTGSVAAPAAFAGLSPAPSYSPADGISLSSDFTQTWTPGPAGSKVTLNIYASTSGSISCTADDSAGTVTVPTALLSLFTSTDTGTLAITRAANTAVTATNANVSITASISGPGGFLSFGGVIDAGPAAGPLFTKPTALVNDDQFDPSTGTDPSQALFAGLMTAAAIPYSEYTNPFTGESFVSPSINDYVDGGVTTVIYFTGSNEDDPIDTGSGNNGDSLVQWLNASGGHVLVLFSPGGGSYNGVNSWAGPETDEFMSLFAQGDQPDPQDDVTSTDIQSDTSVTVLGTSIGNFSGQSWTVSQGLTPTVTPLWEAINPLTATGSATFDTLATVSADNDTGGDTNTALAVIVGAKHVGTAGTSTIVYVGFPVEDISSPTSQTALFGAIATYAGFP
jgi:hypothetical protein